MSMVKKIVECVPNFSEGRNMAIIKQITDEIERVKGVKGKAGQLIDMRGHHGAHPRMGATDVCPLIPVAGITLEECAELAHKLAERIAREHNIPCYCYEAAPCRRI